VRIAFVDSVHPLLAERLEQAGHVCSALYTLDDAALAEALSDVEGIVVRSRPLSAELLTKAPELRFVARVGAGLENIDREHCMARNIVVLNSPEGNRDGVGEWCVAQTLALLKHLPRANEQVHKGLWQREANRGADLFGKTVGIIGFGHMGSAFAEKLQGFAVQVLAHDKYRKGFATDNVVEADLDELLAACDIISLHLPLTAETRYYANEAFFQRLGGPVWFLNSSRGGAVDTRALLDALDAGMVKGAALDVLEYERPDLDSLDPAMDPTTLRRLLDHPAVLLSPHIAGVTHEGKVKMAEVLATKILNAIPNAAP
jgi:D-3-phosphoglycerate dehydrogenase / 2-oxoglutarate reductase